MRHWLLIFALVAVFSGQARSGSVAGGQAVQGPAAPALLLAQSQPPMSKEEVENDKALVAVIIEFFNKQKFVRYKGGYSSIVEITEITNLEVREIAGNTITAEIGYRLRAVEFTYMQRQQNSTVTVERVGSSYKVVRFE